MHTEPTAQGRSSVARQAARAQLQALRAARRARRGLPPQPNSLPGRGEAPSTPEAPISEASAEPTVDTPDEVMDLAQDGTNETESVAPDPVPEELSQESSAPKEPIVVTETAEAASGADEVTDQAPEAAAHPSQGAPEEPMLPSEDSPLFQLPGAGPGLVWMLNRAGVTTLEELANSDPEALKAEFGVVGQILDLDFWIDWSRQSAG